MPPSATGKTALATLRAAIDTYETSATKTNSGTGNSPNETKKCCRELRKILDHFEKGGAI